MEGKNNNLSLQWWSSFNFDRNDFFKNLFLAALAALGLPCEWSRKHDLTNKKTMTKTNTNTNTKTITKTFREHLQRAIFDIFYLWNIWSEWWENMTWTIKRQRERQRQWQIHLENTFKERSLRLLTFETFDHSDDLANKKQWEGKHKDNDDDKYI